MIAYIQGIVKSYTVDRVVVLNQGIGYELYYPHIDQIKLDQTIELYVYMHVSENDLALFGFSSQPEKELFLKLIGVKGLGPKTALNMLMKSTMDHIISAIETGEVAMLKKLPGIGAKTASQIVLDLKGKLVAPISNMKQPQLDYPQEILDALDGLRNLGYKNADLGAVGKYLSEQPGLTTSQYLKLGLQFLSKTF